MSRSTVMACSRCGYRLPGIHASESDAATEARARGWLIVPGRTALNPETDLCPNCRMEADRG